MIIDSPYAPQIDKDIVTLRMALDSILISKIPKAVEVIHSASGVLKSKLKQAISSFKGTDYAYDVAKVIDNVISNGRITVKSIKSNPSAFSGKNVDEIAKLLKSQGNDVTVKASTKSRSGAQIIKINNPGNGRNITQLQVSPGGGRHGENPYIKISTSDQGIIKIVNGIKNTYKTDGKENATIIFTGR